MENPLGLNVVDPGSNLEFSEINPGSEALGHQSVETAGGTNTNLRVLHCSNVDTSLNY